MSEDKLVDKKIDDLIVACMDLDWCNVKMLDEEGDLDVIRKKIQSASQKIMEYLKKFHPRPYKKLMKGIRNAF